MAKRFTDTNKWSDPWFRTLKPKHKLLWDWFCTNCDIAGTIDPDFGLASFVIGEKYSNDDMKPFEGRMMLLPNGRYWILKYIDFQCGELKKTCPAHKPIYSLINRLSIPYGIDYQNTINSLKEKEIEKDQEKEIEKEEENAQRKPNPLWDMIEPTTGIDPKSEKSRYGKAIKLLKAKRATPFAFWVTWNSWEYFFKDKGTSHASIEKFISNHFESFRKQITESEQTRKEVRAMLIAKGLKCPYPPEQGWFAAEEIKNED